MYPTYDHLSRRIARTMTDKQNVTDTQEFDEDMFYEEENHDDDNGLAPRLHRFIRKFAGEHAAEHLVRARRDIEHRIGGKIRKAKRTFTDKVSEAKANYEARQQLFRRLFRDNDEWGHGNTIDPSTAELWHTRTTSWLDHMVPQGHNWLAVAMETSVFEHNVDLSFTFDIEAPVEVERQLTLDIPRTGPR